MSTHSGRELAAYPSDQGEVFGPVANFIGFTLRSPKRHPVIATALFLSVLLLSAAAALMLPNTYLVQASILAQDNALMNVLQGPENGREMPTRAAREILVRRENLVAIATQTNFVNRYRATESPAARLRDHLIEVVLGKKRTDKQVLDDLVDSLETKLQVGVGQEGTVTIGFEWSDPQIAFDIVQAAMQSFFEAKNAHDIGSVGEAVAILDVHDARLRKEIADATDALDQRERSLRLRNEPPQSAPAAPYRKPIDEDLVRLQGLLTARRRALQDVEEFRQRRLSELQAQLSQELSMLAPEHPTVRSTRQAIASLEIPSPQVTELRAQVSQTEKELTDHGGQALDVMPIPARAAADELAATRARLLEVQDPRLEYERQQLEQLLRRRQGLVERIDRAKIELDAAQASFQNRYSVITPPKLPRGPKRPVSAIVLLAGVVGGAAVAFGASALRDLARGRIVERWQVERGLGLTVLAQGRPRR